MRPLLFAIIFTFANLGIANQLINWDKDNFLKDNFSPERKEIVEFITDQFKQLKNPHISQKKLDELWFDKNLREKLSISRFQIIKQQLYADSSDISNPYFLIYLKYFQDLLKKYQIPDVDYIIFTQDEIPNIAIAEKTLNIPSFLMFKNPDNHFEHDKLLLPEPVIIRKDWNELLKIMANARLKYPWSKKEELFFWRGATTGGGNNGIKSYNFANIANLPRLSLVILSKLYPTIIDATFSKYVDVAFDKKTPQVREFLELLIGTQLNTIPEEEHLIYKYLLSVDGNSCTGTRLPWIMYSNSVTIKQDSKKYEWFYSALKPYYHYVPVASDFINIFEVYDWLKNNDQQLQNIVSNANNFIQNNLMHEHIAAHMQIILKEYAKLQSDTHLKATLINVDDFNDLSNLFRRVYEYSKRMILTKFFN